MRRVFDRLIVYKDQINHKHKTPVLSSLISKRGQRTKVVRGGPPIAPQRTKEKRHHQYYKWNYERLPTQTFLDEVNPQFAIRPPEFKLPKLKGRLSRKIWRQRIAEVERARHDPELEKLARDRQLMLSIEEVENEWREEFGILDLNNISKFYCINRDIFDDKDISIKTWLHVAFGERKIQRGNIVKPLELLHAPSEISFNNSNDCFSTIVLSNLDGHPLDPTKEILHWLVCNIPGNSFSEGNTVVEYLPAIPWKGTGFHRLVFALYEHSAPIDCNDIGIGLSDTLRGRTFSSVDFSSSFDMIPAGLAWCQVQWDDTVTTTCAHLKDLNQEPVFDFEEYIDPKEEAKLLKVQINELKYRNM